MDAIKMIADAIRAERKVAEEAAAAAAARNNKVETVEDTIRAVDPSAAEPAQTDPEEPAADDEPSADDDTTPKE